MTERDFRKREIKLIFSEDGTLKFYFISSLKKIALAKVASLLWMNQSTQQETVNLFHSSEFSSEIEEILHSKWQLIKDNVVAKISELYLPGLLPMILKKTVRVLGDTIHKWILYHDEFFFNIGNNCKSSAVDLISHIAWTARGRIDFAKTAKNILDHDNSLSDDQKYKIACTYCSKDDITYLACKVLNPYYLDSIDIDIYPMVYFWTTHITGDSTKLYNHYNDYLQHTDDNISINEYIRRLLTSYKQSINTVPITYMWNKFSEEEKTKNLTSLVELDNEDLRYSLLSDLDYEQQQDVFKKCSGTILRGILNDLLFEHYFLPIALVLLEIMDQQSYIRTLQEITDKMKENYEENYLYKKYKDFFKILWQSSSRHLKDSIFDNDIIESFVCYSFSWKQDLDIIDLIFKDLNAQQRKKIIFSEDCIEVCSEFIQSDEWDSLESFMRCTLSSEEDIIEFKKTLTRHQGDEIVHTHLLHEAYDKIKPFMDWAFKSKEEEDCFRQSLAGYAYIILISNIKNNEVDFTKLENCFNWCANGDLELINKFKSEILTPFIIKKLIKKNKYVLLNELLNWSFLGNQQRITQFCSNLIKENYQMNLDNQEYFDDDDDDDDDMQEY